jgi:glycosyltransferase involved in cell wall biosynthesis
MVPWVCCQLGAREHYAIPRALFPLGTLERLLTDAWVPPDSLLAKLSGSRPADRFHTELRDAPVKAFNSSLIVFETLARARGLEMWPSIIARNRWFQRKVVSYLRSQLLVRRSLGKGGSTLNSVKERGSHGALRSQPILLSYSYTALEPFRYAKANGWKTILVQIDPGPEEERIAAQEAARVPELAGRWQTAPPEYWALWREECELADRIVVNSEWSRKGLIRGGVPVEKISIIPLAYEVPEVSRLRAATARQGSQRSEVRGARAYPTRFTFERPLRVLFLGLINLRKGVARLLEAARMLRDQPVEFWMVGPVEIANSSTFTDAGRVKWFGAVTRNQAAEFYRDADVFILPTLSDGFAITQLEAQAHGLPVIASKNCGKVVENGLNGIILDEPSAACVAHAVRDCIASPDRLEKLASASGVRDKFTIEALANQLQRLGAIL